MPKGSIKIVFRASLPGGRWRWTDETGEGRVAGRDQDGVLDPPWLLREPDPNALPDAGRVVDRSGVRLYDSFRALAKFTAPGKQALLPDAIVHFAERYGFLGESFALYQPTAARSHALPERPVQAESLQFWGREIQSFYELDSLAEAVRVKDIEWLGKRIKFDREKGEILYDHSGELRWIRKPIATKERHPVRYDRLLNRPRTFDVAWTQLSLELNKRVENALQVFVPPDRERIAVARPRTLLDALYLRLYQKAADIEWPRYCQADGCGKELPADATVRLLYCDDRCRMKHHNPKRRRETRAAVAD
jgi:hypothetical protein